MAPFDLVIKGAHLVNPGRALDLVTDIGIIGGRVAAIEANLAVESTTTVIDARGPGRIVTPGLIDIHAHVAYGAVTDGVGMPCSRVDEAGVGSGVTTIVDGGSCGVSNFGVLPAYVLPDARTDVICFLNVGSFAHTIGGQADILHLDELDAAAIARCVESNPGVVRGFKLRLVGSIMDQHGEAVIARATSIARTHGLPLMVHLGDPRATASPHPDQRRHLTLSLLNQLQAGDIVTHIHTPAIGGIAEDPALLEPALLAARDRGVILDAAVGQGHLSFAFARDQFKRGLFPDTISSDLTARTQRFHSLVECLGKFLAVGYSLTDVIGMCTTNAATALGISDTAGTVEVGRVADLTILDVVYGQFEFLDGSKIPFTGDRAIVPVRTVKRGVTYEPGPATHEWGWLPSSASLSVVAP